MPDKPTPNPSEPDKPEPNSTGNPAQKASPGSKLRLRRIIFEDTEIKPSEDKQWEPAPESQPFEEPEAEPGPIEPIPLSPEQIGTLPPEQEDMAFDDDDDFDDDDFDDDDFDDDEEEEIPKRRPLSPSARLAVILVPAALICGVMIFVLRTFDPFGSDFGRLGPTQIPANLLKGKEAQADSPEETDSQLAATSLEQPRTSLQEFLKSLQEQPLTASINPRGVFIDSVFIPEGAALNKQIGVVFSNLLIENNEALVVVTSPDGTKLALPAQVNLR